ncbi:MAG: hypothetical protein VR72_07965 [Clostridiaceae bacterium BRH_c20a]|nr:MAG: hypothetical protein VR72_07965 [Clostridiaceae bacterium BRH_c20a]
MSIWDGLFSSTIKTSPLAAEGISIEPDIPKIGEEVRISYDGLLADSGAEQIYLHIGNENNWHDLEDIPMIKSSNRWVCDFVPEFSEVNFCFHDNANNWDNNNGANWSLRIEE